MAQTRGGNRRKQPNGVLSKSSLESLEEEAAVKLLDMGLIQDAGAQKAELITAQNDEEKNDENISTPKMNTLVGFLRLMNYLSATSVIFVLVYSGMTVMTDSSPHTVQSLLTGVQLVYLTVLALIIYVDSIGTVSFCWREYGELSSLHTDATSIIFILCSNRWLFRIGSGLLILTALSLPIMVQLKQQVLPHLMYWLMGLICSCLASSLIGFLLSFCVPHHRVPWLQGTFNTKMIRDEADIWKRSLRDRSHVYLRTQHRFIYVLQKGLQILAMIICFTSYLIALTIHSCTVAVIAQTWTDELIWERFFILISASACMLVELISLCILAICVIKMQCKEESAKRGRNFTDEKSVLPIYIWLIAPYTLSCSVRQFLETDLSSSSLQHIQEMFTVQAAKWALAYSWVYFMGIFVIGGLVYIFIGIIINAGYVQTFWHANFNRARFGGRKTIRILDTMASIFMLTSMIIGFASVFIDQYDIVFDPDGIAKEAIDAANDFQAAMSPLSTELRRIIDSLDKKFTCQDVYNTLGTGTAVTLFASFFPGASSVVSMGSRSAYYGVRAANSLTNLAKKLRKAASLIWRVSLIVMKLNKFAFTHLKKIILTSNSVSIGRILPLLPPVVLGIYIMFGVFWPNRLVFFSAKQRRKHMSSRFMSWLLALIVLVTAVVINTVLLDELVKLLDDNIPLAKVTLEHNFGWKLAMTASAMALAGTSINFIVALVLMIQTDKDHENLTNAEKDWKYELEKRELVIIKTAFGDKIQKRTHLKYKRSRISPWTWVLPIILTMTACGFGVLANFYPKLEMTREPRGPFGRLVDKVYKHVSIFEDDMYSVKNDTDMECLPYPTLDDVLADNPSVTNILRNPVNRFYNVTRGTIQPLKQVLTGFRKQLIMDVEDELFGDALDNIWDENHLQYIGMIFVIPRLICLLILVFGCLMASIFLCQMQIICQSLEPRKIVDAYGKVAIFSLVYVVGAQLSLFNILSSFGVPFYHIYVRFGHGFVYDVVADSILLATYIGMNNEFFFAIPKRKTTVTYSVPGVSDDGPNVPGQII